MKDLLKKFEQDRLSKHLNIEIFEVSPGKAKAKMEIMDHHLNSINTVHGGAIYTLADMAYSAAANARGNVAVLINAHMSYIKSAVKGPLYAEAKEVSFHPKIASYTVHIKNSEGEIIAVFQGMCYRKKEKIVD
jgi:acyl-CoA thioesterase